MLQRSIASIAIVFLLFACSDKQDSNNAQQAITINTQKIQEQPLKLNFEYPARLRSIQNIDIYARVEGVLLEQYFTEGAVVQAGDKLFKIDPKRYQARVDIAKAQVESAAANFDRATKDWQRVERLYKQGVLTIDQHDQSLYSYRNARAALSNAKAALQDALIDLEYIDVMANITGRVGMRRYDVGSLVGQGGNSVLTTLTQLNPIYAEFSIPSSDFYFLKNLDIERNQSNANVVLILGNGMQYEHKGRIDFIDSVLDSQTSSIRARAIIDNSELTLVPNDFVSLYIEGLEFAKAIAIPQTAVMQDEQGSYVFVLKDNQANLVRIKLGKTLPNGRVMVLSGLQANDVLILDNLSRLKDKMPVNVQKN